ncbi:MAG: opacity family porin [Bacteroidales bacterium]
MRKFILSLTLLLGLAVISHAQSFDRNTKSITAGIGIGSNLFIGGSSMEIPPTSATFEYSLDGRWGIGAVIGVAGARQTISTTTINFINGKEYRSNYKGEFDYTGVLIGARGAYHFFHNEKWDTYAGAVLGLNIISTNYSDNEKDKYKLQSSGSFVNLGLFGGAKYYFTPVFGLFTELGYNVAFFNAGVSFKF